MTKRQNMINVYTILNQGHFLRHYISRRIMPGAEPDWF